jgi:hypothetical protein
MAAWKGKSSRPRLGEVYRSLVPLLNSFMPTMKLGSKVKADSKEIEKHDEPPSRQSI